MKRNTKPFSVEIKKARVQCQRHQLPLRRLFDATPLEANKVFEKEEPPADPASSPAPRILPSIVEPVWSSSEPLETARHKRRSAEANRGQMEDFNLDASASEDVADAPAEAPVSDEAMPQSDGALDDPEDTGGVYPVQSAQGEGVRVKSRKPRKKVSGTVEQKLTSEPPETAITASGVSSKAVQRRITRRLAAAAQLPRHERWKGRLHPAAW